MRCQSILNFAFVAVPLSISMLTVSLGQCRAQSIASHTIGENRSKLDELGSAAWEYDFGQYGNATFKIGAGVSLSGTIEKSTGKVVRLEASWSGQGQPQLAHFSDFRFEQTSLAAIRQRFGSAGALPGSGSPVLTTSDGGLAISSFYEVASSSIIATFVTKISRDALIDLQRRYGADIYAHAAQAAVLDSVVLSDAAYFKTLRGTATVFDTGYRPITWEPTISVAADPKRELSLGRIKPSQLPVPRIYSGPNNPPDLAGQSASFRTYRTRIADGMSNGPTFSGEYAVIQIDCGAGCSNAFVGNVRTGEVFKLPIGGDDHPNLSLKYELSSRMMIVQSSEVETAKCYVRFFSFDDGEWVELLKQDIGPSSHCQTSITQNLKQ